MDEKNLKTILLKEEYGHISGILHEIEDKIVVNSKILSFSRTGAMKMLNDILTKLNNEYEKELQKLGGNVNLFSHSLFTNINNNILSENSSIGSYDYSDDASSYESSDEEKKDDSSQSDSNDFKKTKYDNMRNDENIIKNDNIDINKYIEENKQNEIIKERNKNHLDEIKEIKIKNIGNKNTKKTKYDKILSFNPLQNIKKDIVNLCKIVGFTSIEDILFLEEGVYSYNKINDEKYDILKSFKN